MLKKQYFGSIFSLILFMIFVSLSIEASRPKFINNSDSNFLPSQKELDECRMDFNKCQDFSNYPHKLVKELIKSGKIKKKWFVRNEKKAIGDCNDDSGCGCTANKNDSSYLNFCKQKTVVTYPKGGFTKTGKFVYIVQRKQANESFMQTVTSIECERSNITEHPICETREFRLRDALPEKFNRDYDFNCFVKRGTNNSNLLVGIDENGKVIRDVLIENPQCCLCGYKKKKYV